ncbi:NmrA family NAD(P)-binding protein [Nocardia africana]
MTVHDNLVLVTGATGKQGGATARALLSRNVGVRILVRDPAAAEARELAALGAQVTVGDFDAPDTLPRRWPELAASSSFHRRPSGPTAGMSTWRRPAAAP